MERVLEETEWMGKRAVSYCDNADANFGILARDEQIAEAFAKTKEKYGFPERMRTSFAKYSNVQIAERVFRIAKILHKSDQLKAVTLALQSTNDQTLVDIKRKNIAMDGFKELQDRYKAEGIPTYTELIIGLPGETYESFRAGLDRVLDSGQHTNLFCYLCSILPNSEMANPEYRKIHGIRSVDMQAMLTHGTPTDGVPIERQETTVATKTMNQHDWWKCYMLAWMIQVCHSFGLTQWWAKQERAKGKPYTRFYEELSLGAALKDGAAVIGKVWHKTDRLLQNAVDGGSWNNVLPKWGDISWPPDEGGFLEIVDELDRFYDELESFFDMPKEQRQHGPPKCPKGKEIEYAKCVWYSRRGDFEKAIKEVVDGN